jgi:hypothetical protein
MARDYEGLARVLEEIARGCSYAPNRARYAQRAEELRRKAAPDAPPEASEPAPRTAPRRFPPLWRRGRRP